jgi:carboxylate-amine ligase
LRDYVEPALQELDATELVDEGIQRTLTDGNGAVKQREAFREGADFIALTEVTP